ncbi:hypothetical protein [Sphingobacterium siyangense]|uniref:hypothetical protein n=1 Tax=Sphingobacterium siyangense TaxID=459529 RepID=UPI002FDCA497
MGTIIIAVFAVFFLFIQRAESNIKNEDVLKKIERFHSKIGVHFYGIVTRPYAETRKDSTKWIVFLFFLMAMLHYVSETIFGAGSVHTLLLDQKILLFTTLIMTILAGHYTRRDFLILGTLLVLLCIFAIYAMHSNIGSIAGTRILLTELPGGLFWKDLFVVLGAVGVLGLVVLFVLISRLISFMLYLLIRTVFKLCLHFHREKPLKPLIVMVECFSIVAIAILSLK